MAREDEFLVFVIQVQAFVILLLLFVIALDRYSREFRDFLDEFIDVQVQRVRRLVAGH